MSASDVQTKEKAWGASFAVSHLEKDWRETAGKVILLFRSSTETYIFQWNHKLPLRRGDAGVSVKLERSEMSRIHIKTYLH